MKTVAAGLRVRFLVFWRVVLSEIFTSPSSARNQTSDSCGRPSGPMVARVANWASSRSWWDSGMAGMPVTLARDEPGPRQRGGPRWSDPAVVEGGGVGLGPGPRAGLLDGLLEVVPHGAGRQVELVGDGPDREAARAGPQDRALPLAERVGRDSEGADREVGIDDHLTGEDPAEGAGQFGHRPVLDHEPACTGVDGLADVAGTAVGGEDHDPGRQPVRG